MLIKTYELKCLCVHTVVNSEAYTECTQGGIKTRKKLKPKELSFFKTRDFFSYEITCQEEVLPFKFLCVRHWFSYLILDIYRL